MHDHSESPPPPGFPFDWCEEFADDDHYMHANVGWELDPEGIPCAFLGYISPQGFSLDFGNGHVTTDTFAVIVEGETSARSFIRSLRWAAAALEHGLGSEVS
jgi:hypothetical protein